MVFSQEQRRLLLKIARERIEEKLLGTPSTTFEQAKRDPAFAEKRGVFVTLKKEGDLRGCIGTVAAERPLGEAVRVMAIQSAFFDPRFPPLAEHELPLITIEISVLTPPAPVNGWQEIVIGRDGIILSFRRRQALFLPQVAPEQGWDLETTLSYLSQKAGLLRDAWRDPGCRFQTFQAEVFGEEDVARTR